MRGRSLQVQLGIRIVTVAVLALGLMVVFLSFLTHGHMHRQTDALLLHLAHAEAGSMVSEGAGIHVHDMSIQLPGINTGLSDRYALVFDQQGNVLDQTANIILATPLPQEWLATLANGDPWFWNTDRLAEELLRLVAIPLELDGKQVYLSVGVAHADLDASLWSFVSLAVPTALTVALLIGFAGVWLIRRRIVDLTHLGEACRQLELFSGKVNGDGDRKPLTVPEEAAEEIHVLADTLRELVDRVESLLETQNRFVAEAAHELRTPLTSLKGDLELALRRDRTGDEYREFITEALTDVDRLKDLALDLLEGARGREGRLERGPESLRELAGEALQRRAKPLEQAGLQITLEIGEHIWVLANRNGTIRVLENLLDNVVRHSRAERLLLRARQDSQKVFLEVIDDGVGIAADLAMRLFHPFQKGAGKGFGLGLYIAHQLMHAQNGDLEVRTGVMESMKGACWTLTFSSGSSPG